MNKDLLLPPLSHQLRLRDSHDCSNSINSDDDIDNDRNDDDGLVHSQTGGDSDSGDCESAMNDNSSRNGDHKHNNDTTKHHNIAKQETRDVLRLRLVVLIVLIVSSVATAATVYCYLNYSERHTFERQFDDDGHKLLDAIGKSIDQTLAAFDGVAVNLISTAKMTNQSWPYVTIQNYAVRMSKVLPLSKAFVMGMYHVVSSEQRQEWELYASQHDDWVDAQMRVQEQWGRYYGTIAYNQSQEAIVHGDVDIIPYNSTRDMLVSWQSFPSIAEYSYSWDALSVSQPQAYERCKHKHIAIVQEPYMVATLADDPVQFAEEEYWATTFRDFVGPTEITHEPVSDWLYPVVNNVDTVQVAGANDYDATRHELVGVMAGYIYWRSLLKDILPTGSDGIRIVFSNPCSNSFTYQILGPTVQYLGVGDVHEAHYDNYYLTKKLVELSDFGTSASQSQSVYSGAPLDTKYCPITLHVYPSDEMRHRFTTHNPIIFTIAVLVIFAFVSVVFFLYDRKVERRQVTVLHTAVRSSAIVSSLFPSEVRDRLYNNADNAAAAMTAQPLTESARAERSETASKSPAKKRSSVASILLPDTAKGKLSNFLRDTQNHLTSPLVATRNDANTQDVMNANTNPLLVGAPIAELYPETTVLFADICGFTAWSSERHPAQVFHLLESVYAAFDAIAKKRGVFKVETIGDCYVAVVGLPRPRQHHAVVMARFARDCRDTMATLTVELAKTLGPGTADLCLRIGLNSGPTTAGVLRGEKSRFQLFGDTVNTAARMESNGMRHKIQVSTKTADLIRAAGKGYWLTLRDERVDCKGKGLLTTYWCEPSSNGSVASVFSASEQSDGVFSTVEEDEERELAVYDSKIQRLVEWNVSMFTTLLCDVVAHRTQVAAAAKMTNKTTTETTVHDSPVAFGKPIKELTSEIPLLESPDMSSAASVTIAKGPDQTAPPLSNEVVKQLHEYIALIAEGYHANPFHNFAHCSHVVMSTKKLLDRITEREKEVQRETKRVDSCTYGITTNPLASLAIVFAALIHDMDHYGVSNARLVEENDPLAVTYRGKSVAEQNSVDVAWRLLQRPQFAALRDCLYCTESERLLFRQVVVNAVLATDLFDKNLKALRETRWQTSFAADVVEQCAVGPMSMPSSSSSLDISLSNRRATIIIDLIIQASDVSHTMQHFTVYKKWNMKLLAEMYGAYQCGRMANDPTIGWYDGELWFFDNYVIPLAQKLRECQVFGVSCDEFLDYAKDNRMEWAAKGQDIVREAKAQLEMTSARNMVGI